MFRPFKRNLSVKIIKAFELGQGKNAFEQGSNELHKSLKTLEFKGKKSEFRLLYNVPEVGEVVGVVGFGPKDAVDASVVRESVSTAVKQIKQMKSDTPIKLTLDDMIHDGAAAEGATLASYSFDQLKSRNKSTVVDVDYHSQSDEWKYGVEVATARTVMETPANLMTPTIFAQKARDELKDLKNVVVKVYDREWVESQKMGAFLSVSNGSAEPLKFLELKYNGGKDEEAPVGLVGKGVTFDSGGISIKPSSGMAMMKGDLGGAAVVLSSFIAIAKLGLPINVVAAIPLTENMPSGTATKPGDVVVASNGLSIEVDNTDAEGRLILADALHYVSVHHKPRALVELSTLTGAMDVALGRAFAGVFASDHEVWKKLIEAGKLTGDRFWMMPFDPVYAEDIKSQVADLKNVGARNAGACTAAEFLKEFVPKDIPYAHIDIAGVMHHDKVTALVGGGMTGRPTRSIIEFIKSLSHE